ncbi:MAG: hypothetical protein PHV61_06415, partial [Limnochordia bacterium]|nr:hypothetical protein [Limnochordia bacterium]
VERCFEDTKSELGFSHFEVRNYQPLMRHMILSAVSYLFLAKVRLLWLEKKSGTDGMPDSDGGIGDGSVIVADGTRAGKIPATNSRHYNIDAVANS